MPDQSAKTRLRAPGAEVAQRLKDALPDAAAERLAALSRRSELLYRLKVRSAGEHCDTFLISFPKVGRTWLRVLIGKSFQQHYGLRRRQILPATAGRVSAPGMPRVLATHDDATQDKPARYLIRNKTPYRRHRVVFLVRDPRDVIVSHYFQRTRRNADPYRGSLAEFLREPDEGLDKIIGFYNAWADQRHVPAAFHLVRYEDLRRDTAGALRQVLDFVGAADIPDEAVRRAVKYASFERTKERERGGEFKNKALRAWDPSDPESFKARRGVVGGYVDYLTPEQVDEVNHRLERLHPLFGYGSAERA